MGLLHVVSASSGEAAGVAEGGADALSQTLVSAAATLLGAFNGTYNGSHHHHHMAYPTFGSESEGSCWETLCLSHIDDHWYGILVEVILFVYAFFGLAIVCDDYLVPALETLCVRWEIREDVAGASFMALGSAAPEIIVNVVSTIRTHSTSDKDATNLGVSAIVGSGVIAFALIPGACAIACSDTLELKRRPLLRDWSAYTIALVLLCVFMSDGEISLVEGLILVIVYVFYLLVVFFGATIRQMYRVKFLRKELLRQRSNFVLEREQSLRETSLLAEDAEDPSIGDDGIEPEHGALYNAVGAVLEFIAAPYDLFSDGLCRCAREEARTRRCIPSRASSHFCGSPSSALLFPRW